MTAHRELLHSTRWAGLSDYVRRWYRQPLAPESGSAEAEVVAVESALGHGIPSALREWYQLVGKRLSSVQDFPTPLDELEVEDDGVCIWRENQNVWETHVPLEGDDPVVRIVGDHEPRNVRASQMLLGMLVSDTLVAAWPGGGVGTLGPVASDVVGGFVEDLPPEVFDLVRASFQPLAWPNNPFFPEPYFGTESVVARIHDSGYLEWMAADREAHERLAEILNVAPSTLVAV